MDLNDITSKKLASSSNGIKDIISSVAEAVGVEKEEVSAHFKAALMQSLIEERKIRLADILTALSDYIGKPTQASRDALICRIKEDFVVRSL